MCSQLTLEFGASDPGYVVLPSLESRHPTRTTSRVQHHRASIPVVSFEREWIVLMSSPTLSLAFLPRSPSASFFRLYEMDSPICPPPMYLSVPKSPEAMFVRFLNRLPRFAFSEISSFSESMTREYSRPTSKTKKLPRANPRIESSTVPSIPVERKLWPPLTPLGFCSSIHPGFLSREANQ